jgi:teichuronic acid biosynthesis glycosyltransferase TuaC
MRRILAVTNVYPAPNSPASGTYVEQQIKGLLRIGLEVDVLFADRANRGARVYRSLSTEVREHIARNRPEIIHVMYGGVMADVVTRSVRDYPTVVSFCGSDLLGENLSGCIRKVISRYGILASHRAAKRADGVIVKAKNLRDALPAALDHSKVKIIANGIDLERFKPLSRSECRRRLGWKAESFNLLFPANGGDPVKRPALAEAAVEHLNQAGIKTTLHHLRGVNHDEVPIWLNASDAVILTSKQEGSANVVKEALACDVPVVSVDVGDVRERISGIEGCYLALPEPADIALQLRMVHQGRRRVTGRSTLQEMSLESVAHRLKDFYEVILNSFERKLAA